MTRRFAASSLEPLRRRAVEGWRLVASTRLGRGYQFHFQRQDRKREGNFLLDFLNFKRDTHISGWWFDALVVVSGELVLFRNYGGQVATDRVEKQRNPLGPLQPTGEAAGAYLLH